MALFDAHEKTVSKPGTAAWWKEIFVRFWKQLAATALALLSFGVGWISNGGF